MPETAIGSSAGSAGSVGSGGLSTTTATTAAAVQGFSFGNFSSGINNNIGG